jgi:sulfur relay (sulfurtransferase) complex TusBCD TusD component (DsrE family)
MEARGFEPENLIKGVTKASMSLMGDWTEEADQIMVF